MSFSFRIARVWGIDVVVHWSLLVYALVLLLVPLLSGGGLAARLIAIGLLFGSVLAHEFGHVLVARFCDGSADRILLWPLGGLASVSLPESPSAHFLTALAGPLVSLALWGAAAVAAGHASGWPGVVCAQAAVLNLGLFLFNLLPAFPLDGGQMLRAVLWRFCGASRALWICVHVAMVIAVVMFVGSLMDRDAAHLNLMLTAVAVFIFFEAWRERQFLLLEQQHGEFWSSRPGVAYNHLYRAEPAPERPRKRGWFAFFRKPRSETRRSAEDFMREEIDPILDKISREGMQSLTARERKVLESARDLLQKRHR